MTKQEWRIGDCLELLPTIEDKSIDMILTDLPYGTTNCKWDSIIPFEPMWEQYTRIIKDNGAIVLTASQPFTSALIMSNVGMFKYEWIYEKSHSTGHLNSKKMPMRKHENVLVFYKKLPTYNPQMTKKPIDKIRGGTSGGQGIDGVYNSHGTVERQLAADISYPASIQKFMRPYSGAGKSLGGVHPTQKPIPLAEYLIKTYTNEGDTVHDSCMGSGWSLHACRNLNRSYIGFEISDEWEYNYKTNDTKLDNWAQ